MLCFVRLSNNPLKPFESCRRILHLFPFPGIELKHYRVSKIICAMESESHSSLHYTFLPSPLNCPRTPGFMSFKGVISVSKDREMENMEDVTSAPSHAPPHFLLQQLLTPNIVLLVQKVLPQGLMHPGALLQSSPCRNGSLLRSWRFPEEDEAHSLALVLEDRALQLDFQHFSSSCQDPPSNP